MTVELGAQNGLSNLTLKCFANTFVKVDALIDEGCLQTISYLKGYSCLKLHCKKLSNQKLTANTVSTLRTTILSECVVILKSLCSSNLLCICSSLLETNLNKAKYSLYEKLSRVFRVGGSRFEEKEGHQLQYF